MVLDRPYKQCARCVMDTTDPDITFNDNGFCNHCTWFLQKKERDKKNKYSDSKLNSLIAQIKNSGKGKKYDCVLGISGGVDSCYAAYILKQFGLRVLLVHMDNGWNSEESVQNIKNIAVLLEMDYESYVLDWDEFRDMQLAFLKASVIEAETPTDIAILGALHQVAVKYGAKYIISGGNHATEGILPRHWHYNAKDTKFINAIQKKFGKRKIKKIPLFGYWQEAYYKFVKGIKIIYLLNYISYSKSEAMELLQRDLKWRYYGGKHYESKYTRFVQSYLLPVKFDLDYRKATFSNQICEGKIAREQALKELVELSYDPDKIEGEKGYIEKKLGITAAELNEIILSEPKTFRDYPNDRRKLEYLYQLYRRFFRN